LFDTQQSISLTLAVIEEAEAMRQRMTAKQERVDMNMEKASRQRAY
jgi:hypothetical protein